MSVSLIELNFNVLVILKMPEFRHVITQYVLVKFYFEDWRKKHLVISYGNDINLMSRNNDCRRINDTTWLLHSHAHCLLHWEITSTPSLPLKNNRDQLVPSIF